jgi:uncharacterized membrane protein
MQYLIALTSIILGSIAQFFLKMGVTAIQEKSKDLTDVLKQGMTNLYLWVGLLLYGLSLLLWFVVLSRMELSKAYPMVSLGYIFTLILAYLFLGEAITIAKVTGIGLILIGVIVLTR